MFQKGGIPWIVTIPEIHSVPDVGFPAQAVPGALGVSRNLMVLHMWPDSTCTRRLYTSRVSRWLKPVVSETRVGHACTGLSTQPLWPGCAAVACCPLTRPEVTAYPGFPFQPAACTTASWSAPVLRLCRDGCFASHQMTPGHVFSLDRKRLCRLLFLAVGSGENGEGERGCETFDLTVRTSLKSKLEALTNQMNAPNITKHQPSPRSQPHAFAEALAPIYSSSLPRRGTIGRGSPHNLKRIFSRQYESTEGLRWGGDR